MSEVCQAVPTVLIGGLHISRLNFDQTLRWIEERLLQRKKTHIATANLDFLYRCAQTPQLKQLFNEYCHLVTADGMPVVWLSRRRGLPISERVAGADLVPAVAALAAKHGLRVFLLGGERMTAETAAKRLVEANPRLQIAGIACPWLQENDSSQDAETVAKINVAHTDILFAALGCPKQEHFIARNRETLSARFAIGVGGSFDFIAGTRWRAPIYCQKLGMEWLIRMLQEPRRLAPRYFRNFIQLARLTQSTIFQNHALRSQ